MIRVTLRQARAIEAGRATQVRVIPGERRQVKRKDAARRDRSAMRWQEPWHPTIGAEETVIGHDDGDLERCRVAIVDRYRAPLGRLTPRDVKACGHTSTAAFMHAWVRDHDKAWMERNDDRLDAMSDVAADALILARFHRLWADREVWVITVRNVAERHLLADPRKGRGDYTNSPGQTIDRDAECVDKATQDRISAKAKVKNIKLRATFQDDLEKERAAKKAERGRSFRQEAA